MENVKLRYVSIINPFKHIIQLVSKVSELQPCSAKQLQKSTNLRGGLFGGVLRDAKMIWLIQNGGKFTLTDKGKRLVESHYSPDIIKEIGLTLPLFAKVYEHFGTHTPSLTAISLFLKKEYPNDNETHYGRVARRILETVYQKNNIKEKVSKRKISSAKLEPTQTTLTEIDQYFKLNQKFRDLDEFANDFIENTRKYSEDDIISFVKKKLEQRK